MSDTVSTSSICFEKDDFNLYLFLLITFIVYLLYIITVINNPIINKSNNYDSLQKQSTLDTNNALINRINELQNEIKLLSNNKIQNRNTQIQSTSLQQKDISLQNKFLDKLYNPLSPPENIIESGTFNTPRYDAYTTYQNLGYLTGNGTQYNVFGRWMYPNKSDRWQYYVINNDRSRIKIPFKTKNNNELYDGDTIDIPELGNGFVFKKYENEGIRYNPNII
jgi:hypothetical protein